jgi:hypothetical protein
MNFLFCYTILKTVISSPSFTSPVKIFLVRPFLMLINLTSYRVAMINSLFRELYSQNMGKYCWSSLYFFFSSSLSSNSRRLTLLLTKQIFPWSIREIKRFILAFEQSSIVWMHWSDLISQTLIAPVSSAVIHIGLFSITSVADTNDRCPTKIPIFVASWYRGSISQHVTYFVYPAVSSTL